MNELSTPIIYPFYQTVAACRAKPNFYNVIVTIQVELWNRYPELVKLLNEYALSYKIEYFDDIDEARVGYFAPQKCQIENLLEYSRGKDNLICSCWAGISRSSAMAYLVQTDRLGGDCFEAVKILSYDLHYPNQLVVDHGARILDTPSISALIHKWKEERNYRLSHNWEYIEGQKIGKDR